MRDERYLNDGEIARLLDDVDEGAKRIRESRGVGSYSAVSFYVGALNVTISRIRARNAEIDRTPEETMGQ